MRMELPVRVMRAVSFTVEPKLYQRAWFFPLLGLVGGWSLIVATGSFAYSRLKHRFDEVLAERSRIARELHDTLLQGLSGITMQLQALWTKLPSFERTSTIGRNYSGCSAVFDGSAAIVVGTAEYG